MKRTESSGMEAEQYYEENDYVNNVDLSLQRAKRSPNAKDITATANTQHPVITALGVLLILAFLIMVILTSLLFNYYKNFTWQVSHLKNNNFGLEKNLSALQESVANIMEDLRELKKEIKEASCTRCPDGWQLITSKCYYFQKNGETWEKSQEECAKLNSVLLILKDRAEMDSLLPVIGQEKYWLGLRRNSTDLSNWLWADGSRPTFSAWNTGEPNNAREQCAEILGDRKAMNDVRCENKIGYICKRPRTC